MASSKENRLTRVLALVLATLGVTACTSDRSAADEDAAWNGSSERATEDGLPTFVFYKVRPDFRDCISPLCGGAFVKAVNRRYTICADGSLQEECYVAVENYDGLGLDPSTLAVFRNALYTDRAIVRGFVIPHEFEHFGNLGELLATEGWWTATDGPPLGTFWRLRGPEFECITYPCFNIAVARLNSRAVVRASDLDLTGVPGIDGRLIQRAFAAMRQGNLISTGEIAIPDPEIALPDGEGVFFHATQLYFRLE